MLFVVVLLVPTHVVVGMVVLFYVPWVVMHVIQLLVITLSVTVCFRTLWVRRVFLVCMLSVLVVSMTPITVCHSRMASPLVMMPTHN